MTSIKTMETSKGWKRIKNKLIPTYMHCGSLVLVLQ